MTGAADLRLIVEVAAEAADIAMHYFRQDPEVWWKEGSSPVSEADLAVDAHLGRRLQQARPGYGWVSEETATRPAGPDETRFFVVDPIDGTRAYLRGEPTWCVSVAVVENGRPVAGVLHAPVLNEVFTASASEAAALNGQAIRVAEPREPLQISAPDGIRRKLEVHHPGPLVFQPNAPSLAYRLALIACGRLDGTLVSPRANDWDVAAGDLILERAGGTLSALDGERHIYRPEPKRHGVLVAGADHALGRLIGFGSLVA